MYIEQQFFITSMDDDKPDAADEAAATAKDANTASDPPAGMSGLGTAGVRSEAAQGLQRGDNEELMAALRAEAIADAADREAAATAAAEAEAAATAASEVGPLQHYQVICAQRNWVPFFFCAACCDTSTPSLDEAS